jgi:uncharacterized membrane protein
MPQHAQLPDAGTLSHFTIDQMLHKLQEATDNLPVAVEGDREDPEDALANLLTALETLGLITDSTAGNAPVEITGARDDPEDALANLLTALATIGLITDSTTAS